MTDVAIEVIVPHNADPLSYRGKLQNRATQLGWPEPHSGGTSFTTPAVDGHLVVDLEWELDTDPGPVIRVLEDEFDVHRVMWR